MNSIFDHQSLNFVEEHTIEFYTKCVMPAWRRGTLRLKRRKAPFENAGFMREVNFNLYSSVEKLGTGNYVSGAALTWFFSLPPPPPPPSLSL